MSSGPSKEALAKYREFHRKDVRATGQFDDALAIPDHGYYLGDSVHILYRSNKVDPDTGIEPKRPIDYIHEHDSWGVKTYAPPGRVARRGAQRRVDVPDFVREVDTLVLLGRCLGLAYKLSNGTIVELEARGRPLSELYTTPCGRALIVICDKAEIEYLVWGGGLGVRDVGIIG